MHILYSYLTQVRYWYLHKFGEVVESTPQYLHKETSHVGLWLGSVIYKCCKQKNYIYLDYHF